MSLSSCYTFLIIYLYTLQSTFIIYMCSNPIVYLKIVEYDLSLSEIFTFVLYAALPDSTFLQEMRYPAPNMTAWLTQLKNRRSASLYLMSMIKRNGLIMQWKNMYPNLRLKSAL